MKKYTLETNVGVFIVFGLICIGYMTITFGHFPLFGDQSYKLSAGFTSVTGLRPGSLVYISGIEVGRVEQLSIDQENQKGLVEMRIHQGIEIYDDAFASIKTEGLIGDMHVSIDPGGGGTLLKPGGIITETQPPIDIADLIGKYVFGGVE